MSAAGWYLSEQACQALRTAHSIARENEHWWLGTDHLLAGILAQWDDPLAGGPALLRACGLTDTQAREIAAEASFRPSAEDRADAPPVKEPQPNPALRFTLDQAYRIAAAAHDPYVGTEHLLLALFWNDHAHELRRLGIDYARVAEQFSTLPRTERLGPLADVAIEPLETVAVPTPIVANLAELARQQAEQQPVEGDGRITTLHYLLTIMADGAADKLLRELGVTRQAVLDRLSDAEATASLVKRDDWRGEEMPLEGWEKFDITPEEWEVIHPRVGPVIVEELWSQGVRFGFNLNKDRTKYWVCINPGQSGLEAREVLDRLLGLTTT